MGDEEIYVPDPAPADPALANAPADPAPAAAAAPEDAIQQKLNRFESMLGHVVQNQQEQQRRTAGSNLEHRLQTDANDAESKVEAAREKLRSMRDEGFDAFSDEGVRAQEALAEAIANRTRLKAEQENVRREMQRLKESTEQQGRLDTTNLESWKRQNPWYEKDAQMTAEAKQIHAQLEKEGRVEVGSEQYFQEIDQRMRQSRPDMFGGAQFAGGGGQYNSPARAAQGGGSRGLRMSPSMVEAMKEWNMTPEQWIKGRNQGVSKGFLNDTPEMRRVIQ